MNGTNDKGYYKIPESKYDIGDTVTVYQNPDSANAKGSMYLFFNEKMSIVYAMTMFS